MCGTDGFANNPDPTLTTANIDSKEASDPDATLSSSAAAALSAAERASTEPTSIGPYQLTRKLGEGGMGQVWLADQTAPIQRQVALKLIKVGRYDDSVLHRFYAERQSLAIMEHPAIAKVFDAGATPDGQPYFVMEYVPGVPITDYCDRKRLTIRERLELFVKVCEGVQHAHQKAIMHRDLKPANILVVEVDGKPVPRIIDFGLAKAASPKMDSQTLATQMGGWVGTPGYMSPEQADPGVLDVDTRTDVYSLGAVLYELLTGFLPFETKDWRKQRFDEFLRHLREEDPPRPSTKVGTKKDSSKTRAEVRGTELKHLVRLLHGDLDWITMKALEKDRARRYGTPSELAADIERYLRHEPVAARPASTGYRLRKYIRRHRLGVAVAAGLVLLLAGFAGMQAVQVRRITRERDRANRVTMFMTDMFRTSDPNFARGNSITAREVLDKASTTIETGLAQDPELQTQLMVVMSNVYDELGLYAKSQYLASRAVAIGLPALGPKNPATILAQASLGEELWHLALFPEAERVLTDNLRQARASLGPSHKTTLRMESMLSLILMDQGRSAEAEGLSRDVVARYRRIYGPEDRETILALYNLCAILGDEGKYAESEKLNRDVLDLSRRVLGPDHHETLAAMTSLANTLSDEGRYEEAQKLTQQSLDISLRIYGRNHPFTAGLLYDLACLAALRGEPDQALSLLRQAIAAGVRSETALKIDKDSDLKSLRGNPEFDKIVAEAKQRAATPPKPD